MILNVTKSTLDEIKNATARESANKYVQIYQDFMQQVQRHKHPVFLQMYKEK